MVRYFAASFFGFASEGAGCSPSRPWPIPPAWPGAHRGDPDYMMGSGGGVAGSIPLNLLLQFLWSCPGFHAGAGSDRSEWSAGAAIA